MAYIGTKPTIGNFQICDAISVVNGQAAYTMQVGSVNVVPQSANHMIVSLNGTIQKPNSSYTVSGSTITFASNLATGDVIDFIQILGDVLDLGVPSDATVSTAKIVDGAITSAKLASGVGGVAGITSSADATAMTITDAEKIGIGEATPLGQLHVKTADSSASVLAGADEIVAEGSGDSGISILSGTSGTGTIAFGDSDDNDIGMIQYLHAQNSFALTNNAGLKLQIDNAGKIGTGSSDGTLVIQGGASYPGARLSLSGGIASTDPGTFKFLADSGSDTDPAERMRLTDSGTLRILHGNFGNTPSSSNKGFEFRANGSNGGTLDCAITATGNHTIINFDNGNGGVGTIQMNGSATAYNTSSDYRLKENVNYTWDATSRLKQLKPARFNFKADADTTVDGFIAHEVSSVVPEAISGEKDAVREDGSIQPQGIDQSKLVPLLVKTIQELEARITELENA
jgi:hypothetical protein